MTLLDRRHIYRYIGGNFDNVIVPPIEITPPPINVPDPPSPPVVRGANGQARSAYVHALNAARQETHGHKVNVTSADPTKVRIDSILGNVVNFTVLDETVVTNLNGDVDGVAMPTIKATGLTTPIVVLPTTITGLWVWHKRATGIYSDAGVTPQTTNGGAIRQWNDQSGNGHHLTQATLANRPTLDTVDQYLGANVIKFIAASSNYFAWPFSTLPGTPDAEIFISLKATSDSPAANRGIYLLNREGSGGVGTYYPATTGHIQDSLAAQGRTDLGAPGNLSTSFHLLNISENSTTGKLTAWLDGVQIFNGPPTGTPLWNKIAIYLGCAADVGDFFDGLVSEFYGFGKVLSTTERSDMTTYGMTA